MRIRLKYRREYAQGGFGGGPGAPPQPPAPPTPATAATGMTTGTRPDGTPRQGYDSTILTSGSGVANQPVAKKTLLGS